MAERTNPDPNDPPAAITTGFDATMGFRMIAASREEVVIEYDIEPKHLQPYGIVHGGVHCAAIETACSTGAAVDAMTRGFSVVGIENHTSFLHAARSGRVRVTATPLVRGRRSQVWEATARDAQDRLIASGRVRVLCLEAGTQLAGEAVSVQDRFKSKA